MTILLATHFPMGKRPEGFLGIGVRKHSGCFSVETSLAKWIVIPTETCFGSPPLRARQTTGSTLNLNGILHTTDSLYLLKRSLE